MRGASPALVARSQDLRAPETRLRALFDGVARKSVLALFSRVTRGTITVVDGADRFVFGGAGPLTATITIQDPAAYRTLLLGGSVGAGEGYMNGEWTCDDLPALLRIFASNLDAVGAMEGGPARVARLASEVFTRTMRRNTVGGSRRNIARHYDLSNELFALFLDPSMTYSSGIFASEAATLEDAQLEKLDTVCRKLALAPGDHLLEIGTGWGALAIHAARRYGCRVTTTTVSVEQHRMATERVREAGMSERVTVLLRDYRELDGTYDKLVSIEMIEAVGHAYMDRYFRACSERLAPHGQMLLQAITIADQAHAQHRASVDFIKQYIFPGSEIPSVTSMLDSTTRATDLRLFHLEDITPHYARTLRIWRERFMANAEAVRALGFDERFLRMWEYYLAYCEGGFDARYLGSVQMVLTKPGCQKGALSESPR
jgi:cyclopropane-fatty-acyl-phospholipid synthase